MTKIIKTLNKLRLLHIISQPQFLTDNQLDLKIHYGKLYIVWTINNTYVIIPQIVYAKTNFRELKTDSVMRLQNFIIRSIKENYNE